MKLYRFSPISNEKQLLATVRYIVRQNTLLCRKITGKALPISYVTVFSHFPAEYRKLKNVCNKLGEIVGENNGPKFAMNNPIKIGSHKITYLRIRKPDTYRMHAGCCDLDADYGTMKAKFSKYKNSRIIKHPDMEMIEFFHPEFDVLAYVVKK